MFFVPIIYYNLDKLQINNILLNKFMYVNIPVVKLLISVCRNKQNY